VLLFGRAAAAETPSSQKWLDDGGLAFRENKGQIKDTRGAPRPEILFTADVSGVRMFFQKNRISYVYSKYSDQTGLNGKVKPVLSDVYRMDVELLGANPGVVVKSEIVAQAAGYDNFYTKNAPQGILNVKAYEKITYQNIYPNIDLVYYTSNDKGNKALKYDFVVHPGGKTSDIQMRYVSASSINLTNSGNVAIANPFGSMEENAPFTYQSNAQGSEQGSNSKTNISSRYKLNGDVISFEVDRYDSAKDLVIDPLQVVWGTYYGGTANEVANSMVLDKDNNVVFTGSTKSKAFPITLGKTTLTNDYADAYVVKFSPTGTRTWGTYYGGSDDDEAIDVFTDPNTGKIAITGTTGTQSGPDPSGDFPITPSAEQTTFGGGRSDAFLVYFNTNGTAAWASYLGGGIGGANESRGADRGKGLVINKAGEIILVGSTFSSDFPTASGGSTNYAYSGRLDAFITKWNNSGNLLWSTYYGGSLDDDATDVAIDDAGNFYVTGYSQSSGFPISPATFQGSCNSCGTGFEDAYVIKFNAGTSLAWGTFYGGNIDDRGEGIAVSKDGTNLYVTGITNSSSAMTTNGVFQPTYGNVTDGFVLNMNGTTGQRNWSSYLGGSSLDEAYDVAIDANGNGLVVGNTLSSGFASKFPLQSAKDNSTDGFLTLISKDGKTLRYSTFYGGNNADNINSVSIDNTGAVYIAGQTQSTNLQLKAPIFQSNNSGGQEAFVAKLFCSAVPFVVTTQGLNNVCSNAGSIVLNTNPANVQFFGTGIVVPGSGEPYRFNTLANGVKCSVTGEINKVKAILPDACNDTIEVSITVFCVPTATVLNIPNQVCKNGAKIQLSVQLSDGSTPASVKWNEGPGIADGTTFFDPNNANVGPNNITGLIVTTKGCTLTVNQTINVIAAPTPTISGLAPSYCVLSGCVPVNLSPAGGILSGPGASGTQFCPQNAGAGTHTLTYTVTQNGCTGTTTTTVTVTPTVPTTITGITNGQQFSACDNGTYTLVSNPPGATFTNNGASFNATFSPKNLGVGNYNITATPANGVCATAGNISFSITAATTASISGLQPSYCELPAETITVFANPSGGTLTGVSGISGSGPFTFPKPGVGSYTLTYTQTNGCPPATATFTVTPAPTPVITVAQAPGQPADTYCKGDNSSYAFSLSLPNIAGNYTINGTSVGSLIPSQWPVGQTQGPVTITFTPFPNVCARPATKVVNIVQQVTGTLDNNPKGPYCTTSTTAIVFTGSPAGGSYTLNGAPFNGTMNPPFTAGSYIVNYTQGSTVCATNPNPVTITIQASPAVQITGIIAGSNYCVTDQNSYPLTPLPAEANCTCTGPGVSGNTFRPSVSGAGTHTITCTPAPGTCFVASTTTVTVASQIQTTVQPSVASPQCATFNQSVTFNTQPSANGTWSITTPGGQVLNLSGPSATINPPYTVGTYNINFTAASNVCASNATSTFTFTQAPTSTASVINGPTEFCNADQASYSFNVNPANSTLSGNGVSNNTFRPSGLPAGTYDVTVTPPTGSCFLPTTIKLTVKAQVPSSISGISNGQVICKLDKTTYTLVGSPAGGTFSCSNGATSTINQANLPAGFYTCTYTPPASACAQTSTISFTIIDGVKATISGISSGSSYCVTDNNAYQLFATPAGGTFSGPGVNGNTFTPSVAGVNPNACIIYTPPAPSATVCASPETLCVKINGLAPSSITAPANGAQFCITDNSLYQISFTPAGGTVFVNGQQTGSTFSPASLPLGNSEFEVRYPANLCVANSKISIIITDSPNSNITPLVKQTFCITDNTDYPLAGSPPGGTFTGTGVLNGTFRPSRSSIGNVVITYTPDAKSCAKQSTINVTVNNQTTSQITSPTNGQVFCKVDVTPITLSATPAGGTWTLDGSAISGNTLSAANLTVGFHTLTYTPAADACALPSTAGFTVLDAQKSVISGLNTGSEYCSTDKTAYNLFVNPPGGQLSGPGISGNTWTPANAGTGGGSGEITIIYTPPTPSAQVCAIAETLKVRVKAPTPSSFITPTNGTQYCNTDTRQIQLQATPAGATFYVDGNPTGNVLVPKSTPLGQHRIEARYFESACIANSEITITITDAPSSSITGVTEGQIFCENDNVPKPLTGTPAGGTFTGNGVSNNAFTPSVARSGTHVIRLTFPEGTCAKETTLTVQVKPLGTSSINGTLTNGALLCANDPTDYTFTGLPAGGSFTLTGPTPQTGISSVRGTNLAPGFYTLTYNNTTTEGCALPSTISFTVQAAQDAQISGIANGDKFCTTDPTSYQLFGSPNGTFSGPGVSNNAFRPQGLNGSIVIDFTPTAQQGICAKAVKINVTVNSTIPATIDGLGSSYCSNQNNAIELKGTPTGGQFKINGVFVGNSFVPSAYASQSPITVTYEFSDPKSCLTPATQVVTITPSPTVSVTLNPNNGNDICREQTPFTVTGSPFGGTFTIDGQTLSGNPATINPANYPAGTRRIVYSGTVGSCQYAETLTVVFNNPPLTQIGGVQATPYCPTVCVATPLFGTPAGGTFSGPGVSGNSFTPCQAGSGTHEITYKGVFKGCAYEAKSTVVVAPKFDVKLFGMAKSYCITDVTRYTFTAEPKGGTWAGLGLNQQGNDAIFIPRNSRFTPGQARIEYWGEYNGCPYYKDTLIDILDAATSSFTGLNTTYCEGDNSTYTLTGTPAGGTFSGKGINGNTFKPSEAGFGFYEITYTPPAGTSNSTCYSPSKAFVTVTPNTLDLGLTLQGQSTIVATVSGSTGNVTYTLNGGTPTSNNVFTGLAAGSYTICAKDDAGCTDCQTININQEVCNCPANIAVSNVAISSARVTWVANPSATSYRVRYRKSGEVNYTEAGNTTNFNFDLVNLEGSQTYDVVINSICANGSSTDCNISVTTFDCKAPDFFEAREVGASTAVVEWDEVLGSVGYELQLKELAEPESAWRPVPAIFLPNGTLNYQFTGLKVATDYVSRLRTVCTPDQFSPLVFAFFTTENVEGPAQVDVKNVLCEGNEVVVNVEWTPAPNAEGYRIEYRLAGTEDVPTVVTVGNVTSAVLRGLPQGKDFQLWVRTIGAGGNSFSAPTFSNQPFFSTPTCGETCPAPSAVKIEVFTNPGAGNSEATISWQPVSGATSYVVEYRPNGTGAYQVIPVNDFTIDLTGLDCGNVSYQVRIKAICNGQESPYASAVVAFDANACNQSNCPIPVFKPTVVYKDVNDYAVQMRWFTVKVDGHYYEVQYAKTNEAYGAILPVNPDPVNDTMYYHISKLDCPADYKFRVRTVCFDESRSEWIETNFRIDLCNQEGCPAPFNVRTDEISLQTATITFNRVAQAVNGYILRYRPVGTQNYIIQNLAQTSDVQVKVVLNNLIPETEYEGDIQSVCASSVSDRTPVNFITVDCQSPFRFDVTEVTSNSIAVEWDLIPTSLGYQVEIRSMTDPLYDGTKLVTLGPERKTYTFEGLASNRQYEVRIRSICVNNKSFSPWTYNTGTTNSGGGGNDCEAIIGNIEVTSIEATAAAISWLASGSVSGYRLEYRTINETNWKIAQESDVPFAFLQGLTSCTNYIVQVSVICLDGKVSAPVTGAFQTSCVTTCSPVTNVSASSTCNEITVNWSAPQGTGTVENYAVQYRALPNGTFNEFPGLVTSNTSITIPNATPNTQYEVVVRAKCTGGPNDYSNPVMTMIGTPSCNQPCVCPANIAASAITNTSAMISWTANANALSYTIRVNGVERQANNTSFDLNTLTQCTDYIIEVRSNCANGNSDFCSTAFKTTGCSTGCQGVDAISIGNPVFSVIGDKVTVSLAWGSVATATEYTFRYKVKGGTTWTDSTTTNTNITINGLVPCTQYEFVLVTRCADGTTSTETQGKDLTTPCGSCTEVSDVVIDPSQITNTTANISWTGVSNARVYMIRYRRSMDAENAWLKTDSTTHPTTTYTMTNLEPGTNYIVCIMVKCLNGGMSGWSCRQFATAGGNCVVPQLSILSSTVTCKSAKVAWSTSPFAQEYEIQSKEGNGAWSAPVTSQGSEFELTSLKQNLNYMVRIKAICAGGSLESEFDTVTFMTPPCIAGEGTTWQITSGGLGWDEAHSVAATKDGGYVVTGYTFSWGAGEWDVYLAKYNQFGGKLWDKTYGTPNRDEGRSVRATSDGGYIIAGYTDGKGTGEADIYVIKTNDLGEVLWERSYGSPNYTVGYDIRETNNGFIIAGTGQEVGAGGRNIQLIQIDNNGGIVWQKTYGGNADDYGYGVTVTKDGGYAVVGYTQSLGNGQQDLLVMKVSSTGAVLWAKTVGGGGRDYGYGIAEDNDGNIAVTGYTRSYQDVAGDVLVSKFDGSGNPLWTKTYGNTSFDFGNGITATKDGHFVITGGNALNNTNASFLKIDGTGKLVASKLYGGAKTDQGRTVVEALDGGFVIAGQSNTFDGTSQQTKNAEVYLIKTDAVGNSCVNATDVYPGVVTGTPNSPSKDVTNEVTITVKNTTYTVTSQSGVITAEPKFVVNAVCAPSTCADVINLAVTNIKGSTADVVWTPVGLALYYELRYKVTTDTDFSPYIKVDKTSYSFGAIAPNTNYTVEVRAICIDNASASNGQTTTFNSGVLTSNCNAPMGVNVTGITNGSATVKWTAIPNVSGYVVSYREVPGNFYITTFVQPTESSFEITGLKATSTYHVRVLTVCVPGDNSPFTLEIPFMTLRLSDNATATMSDLSLYPNPTRGDVNIRFNTTTTEPATIHVFDVTGRKIATQTITPTQGENEMRLDLTGNAAGVYMLRFSQGSMNQTVKVVVE